MIIKLPIKTVSEANLSREHWTKKHKRHKMQKEAIRLACSNRITPDMLPCTIKLTRIAPRKLDQWENLPCSFKFILDSIASLLVPGKAIGQADSDNRIKVKYDQIKGGVGEYAIEIEIIKQDPVLEVASFACDLMKKWENNCIESLIEGSENVNC